MPVGATSIFRNVFGGLDDEGLDELRRVAKVAVYPPETRLIMQGEVGTTLFVVVEGRVAVTQQLEDGQERLLGIRGPREIFGELALLDDTPRMASCITLIETTVLEVTEETFDRVLENSPGLAYMLMRHVVGMLRENDKTAIEGLLKKNKQLQRALEDLEEAQDDLVEKERMERELEIAAEVQRSILPGELPQFEKYRFAAFLQPARRIGGDLYNVIDLDEDHCGILIADVADKSVQAALYMAVITTLFQVISKQHNSPREVALAVHANLMEVSSGAEIFVTAFYGILCQSTGVLTYIIAGQDRPLLVRQDQPIETLPGRGRFLGMIDPLELDEYTIQLKPGDRLLLYSDGAVDAESFTHEQFGINRLKRIIEYYRGHSIEDFITNVSSEITAWVGRMSAFDDLTLLAIEVLDNEE